MMWPGTLPKAMAAPSAVTASVWPAPPRTFTTRPRSGTQVGTARCFVSPSPQRPYDKGDEGEQQEDTIRSILL
jgi:hypothetical protein